MAVDAARLQLILEVQANQFSNALKKQNAQAYRLFRQLEDRASQMEKGLGASFSALGKRVAGLFAGLAVGSALNDIRKVADEYTKIINTLKVAGVKDTAGVFDQLFASAQKNAAPLDALATLYGRISAAQTTLNATSGEVMQVTDIVAQSLRAGGTSASEASGALLQLGQALAGGKIQAEEWNSLIDSMRPLLEAAAHGIKEAGGDVARLTALVKSGQVSSEAFFRGIQAGSPILEQKLAGAAVTTQQALQRMSNEFTKAVGEFDEATGTTEKIAGAMNSVADSIGGVGRAATTSALTIGALVEKLGALYEANGKLQRQQALSYQNERAAMVNRAREMGVANAGGRQAVSNERQNALAAAIVDHVNGDIGAAFDTASKQVAAPQPPARPSGLGGPNINPISLSQFKVPGDKDGKGGGGSSKDTLDSYEKALVASEKRRQALLLEAETEGKGTFARAKAREALELETAAKRAGIPVTEQMRAAIERAATGYAAAKVKVEEVQKAVEAFQDAQKFFGDGITDALGDMIIDGEKASEVMRGLVKQLARAALQAALIGGGPVGSIYGIERSAA